jgi:hypothetical protein
MAVAEGHVGRKPATLVVHSEGSSAAGVARSEGSANLFHGVGSAEAIDHEARGNPGNRQ